MERAPLTKKFLFSLASGLYLVSNCYNSDENGPIDSIFRGYIPEASEREQLWKQIKQVGADGRLCYIYKNEDEYTDSLKAISTGK